MCMLGLGSSRIGDSAIASTSLFIFTAIILRFLICGLELRSMSIASLNHRLGRHCPPDVRRALHPLATPLLLHPPRPAHAEECRLHHAQHLPRRQRRLCRRAPPAPASRLGLPLDVACQAVSVGKKTRNKRSTTTSLAMLLSTFRSKATTSNTRTLRYTLQRLILALRAAWGTAVRMEPTNHLGHSYNN